VPLTQDQKQALQGAALVIGANLISRGLTKVAIGEKDQDEEVRKNYEKLDKPSWKIPTWLFGPAWLSINAAQAYGTNKLWNQPSSSQRTTALGMHALTWALFVSWSPGSLALKSQMRSAVFTFLTTAAAGACVYFGNKVDRKIGLAYVPMTIWGLYASAQSAWIAKHNR
jgi:tryptophan-rich sensory protein